MLEVIHIESYIIPLWYPGKCDFFLCESLLRTWSYVFHILCHGITYYELLQNCWCILLLTLISCVKTYSSMNQLFSLLVYMWCMNLPHDLWMAFHVTMLHACTTIQCSLQYRVVRGLKFLTNNIIYFWLLQKSKVVCSESYHDLVDKICHTFSCLLSPPNEVSEGDYETGSVRVCVLACVRASGLKMLKFASSLSFLGRFWFCLYYLIGLGAGFKTSTQNFEIH